MNRKYPMRRAAAIWLVALAGCQSTVVEGDVPPDRVLAGPYELHLAVAPATAHPGERVMVTAEFRNTGHAPLWIPRRRELFLGYRSANADGETWSSSCDGIRYVRLLPGATMQYELAFETPGITGRVEIYTSARRDITVPLQIERWSQSLPLTSPAPGQ